MERSDGGHVSVIWSRKHGDMPSRLDAWLQRLGAYISRYGWCDPSGVTIAPDTSYRLAESEHRWTGSVRSVTDDDVAPVE